jgi:hypothetical protein
LTNLPKAVLAAIVFAAVYRLVDVGALIRMWQVSRIDFFAAAIALVSVLLLGILQGVLLASIAFDLPAPGARVTAERGVPRSAGRHRPLFGQRQA